MKINWLAVLRDTVLVYALTFIGGFILGLSGVTSNVNRTAYVLISTYLAIIGLTISACMIQVGRFKHLLIVAIGVWIISFSNVPLGIEAIPQWFGSIVFYVALAMLGGCLSYGFLRLAHLCEPPTATLSKMVETPSA